MQRFFLRKEGSLGAERQNAATSVDNLLVRIHFIIVMIRWTGQVESPFPGSLTSTFLVALRDAEGLLEVGGVMRGRDFFFFFSLVTGPRRSLSLKLSDTKVYEP